MTDEGYIFRKASDTDKAEILALYHSLIGTEGCTWNIYYPTMEDIEEDLKREALYCLTDEKGGIAAAVFAGSDPDMDELEWDPRVTRTVDMSRLGVKHELQGQGVGARIMNEVLSHAKESGCDGARLLVSRSNPAALALYGKLGFENLGEARMYNIDFYRFEKRLGD